MLPYQATGMVWLPRGAPWLLGYEAEIAQFRKDGKSRHDDQVDPTADGVTLLLGKGTSILSVIGEDKGARAKQKIREAMNHAAAAK